MWNRKEFEKEAKDFLLKSQMAGDTWFWTEHSVLPGLGFLAKKNVMREIRLPEQERKPEDDMLEIESAMEEIEIRMMGDEIEIEIENEIEICAEVFPINPSKVFWVFEYHIAFSEVFQVPVLYFNCSSLDGSCITIDKLILSFDQIQPKDLKNADWPAISQDDHPTLSIPFYFFHPCRTAELMNKIIPQHEVATINKLVSWLSFFGPIIGLTLSLDYFK